MSFNDRHPRSGSDDCGCGEPATICEQTHRGRIKRALAEFRRSGRRDVTEIGPCRRGRTKCYQPRTLCETCSIREIREAINSLIEDTVRVGKKLKLPGTLGKEKLWREKRAREQKLNGRCVSCQRKRVAPSCYCHRHRRLHRLADRRRYFAGRFIRGRDFQGRRTGPSLLFGDSQPCEIQPRFASRLEEFQHALETSQ